MGLRDWLRRRRRPADAQAAATPEWHAYREAGEVVVDDSRGHSSRYPLTRVHSVRVVPLTGGQHHSGSRGWQVTLQRDDGDVLVDKPQPDWRRARDLADQLCQATDLPLDELTQRLFSQVGQYSPKI